MLQIVGISWSWSFVSLSWNKNFLQERTDGDLATWLAAKTVDSAADLEGDRGDAEKPNMAESSADLPESRDHATAANLNAPSRSLDVLRVCCAA